MTPETPRSDEKTANAKAPNRMAIRMVNVLRLIRRSPRFVREFLLRVLWDAVVVVP